MKLLVFGAAGMLGHEVVGAARARGWQLLTPDEQELDITDRAALTAWFRPRAFDALLNLAAFTDVEGAEDRRETAFNVNAGALAAIADSLPRRDIWIGHISTDFVFDGTATVPYSVHAPVNPLSAYGASKAAGETVLRESFPRHFLVRTSWLYGLHGKSFPRTIANLLATRPELTVVDDQRGRPTAAADLAEFLVRSIAAEASGTAHYANDGDCTWFGFAEEVRRLLGREAVPLRPVPSAEFPQKARRPAYSVLRLDEHPLVAANPPRDWRPALAPFIEALVREKPELRG